MVPDASLFGAQHKRRGLASLSYQTFKKKEIDSIWNEWLRVITISGDKFLCN